MTYCSEKRDCAGRLLAVFSTLSLPSPNAIANLCLRVMRPSLSPSRPISPRFARHIRRGDLRFWQPHRPPWANNPPSHTHISIYPTPTGQTVRRPARAATLHRPQGHRPSPGTGYSVHLCNTYRSCPSHVPLMPFARLSHVPLVTFEALIKSFHLIFFFPCTRTVLCPPFKTMFSTKFVPRGLSLQGHELGLRALHGFAVTSVIIRLLTPLLSYIPSRAKTMG